LNKLVNRPSQRGYKRTKNPGQTSNQSDPFGSLHFLKGFAYPKTPATTDQRTAR
jgi:hypothetical protein